MTLRRNRRKHTISFGERLQRAANEAREAARQLPQGPQRDMLMKRVSQAEIAAHINEWVKAPSARAPR
jgi:hypothetical protein